ncbi:MAG: histidine--tRNA ligase [Deltaproteobacteria bacterium]|nr:histidine--tRNA ligase [Deltaproteobacteria bacterium]
MTALRTVKGMHDILPVDVARWHFVEGTYRELVERYGYGEIRTPVLEPLELFVRGIGEATDIVEKEMYAFQDKGGDRLALRPEGTASAIRSLIQHNLSAQQPVSKVYYLGPMFRRERPAKGRYRQFFQAGAELVGADSAVADAEIIGMAVEYLRLLGIKNVRVLINSLGDGETRPRFRKALTNFFGESSDRLCGDCSRRLETNPLRILDCKVPSCREVAANAPSVLDYLSDAARAHFEELQRLLDRGDVPFEIEPTMVRGLDYYTRTIFEIQGSSETLGAQAALVGGGRYDELVADLGGKPTPAIGFSFGIERLLMVLDEAAIPDPTPLVYVAGIGDGGLDRIVDLARSLRGAGLTVEAAYSEASLRSQLKRANKSAAAIVVIAGEDEAARATVTLRDMRTGAQQEVPVAELEDCIGALL